MRRTLVLDEDDLVMVVKGDVVKEIDNSRGEMNRTEFVNYLIQCQLRDFYSQKEYVEKAEFKRFTRQVTELLHNFLQFFISYGMSLGVNNQTQEILSISDKLESFCKDEDETGTS
jgi:hypothetical protein